MKRRQIAIAAVVAGSILLLLGLGVVAAYVFIWRRSGSSKGRRVTFAAEVAAPPPCEPQGRLQVPTYTGCGSDDTSSIAPSQVSIKADFDPAAVCPDCVSISWLYASGLRGQPEPTSDFTEFAVLHNREGRTSKTLQRTPLRGSGWLRLEAIYKDKTRQQIGELFQLPPAFSSGDDCTYCLEMR